MNLVRKNYAAANGTFQVIGKIWANGLYHKVPGTLLEVETYIGDVDVLACVPCPNGGSGPCKNISSFDLLFYYPLFPS